MKAQDNWVKLYHVSVYLNYSGSGDTGYQKLFFDAEEARNYINEQLMKKHPRHIVYDVEFILKEDFDIKRQQEATLKQQVGVPAN